MIHVAVGVIRDDSGDILVARRPDDVHQGGLWEFPGGKVEPGERVREALARELMEELGIEPLDALPLMRIRHDYGERVVLLDIWEVTSFRGVPTGREGQPLRWLPVEALDPRDFPQANGPIIKALSLPDRYLITPDPGDCWDSFLASMAALLSRGDFGLIQLRAPSLEGSRLVSLARECLALPRARGVRVLLNASPALALEVGADGVHLNGHNLAACERLPGSLLVGASTHGPAQLEQAVRLGVDFAVLGPVAPTRSHPGATTLGWDGFREAADGLPLPTYALGGLRSADMAAAREAGARGIAAISGFWPGAGNG